MSARAARRRLSYETWHFVHLYTYLAIALAFAHQFATGADFTDRRVRVLWAAFYVVVAALLLWYRVCVPLRAAFRHRLRVTDVVRENRDVVSIYLTGTGWTNSARSAGQFFRWRFLTRDLWWAANPYSLSAAPSHGRLRITVKITGQHSAALLRLQPGTRVFAEGPYGSFTAARRRRRHVVLIGAGIGITPLRALFEALPGYPGDLTLVYRESSADDLVLRHEIDAIAAARGAQVHYVVGRRHRNRHDPLSADNLGRMLPWLRQADVYLCGPDELTTTLAHRVAQARRAGPPDPFRILRVLRRGNLVKRVLFTLTGTVVGLVALLDFKSHARPVGVAVGTPVSPTGPTTTPATRHPTHATKTTPSASAKPRRTRPHRRRAAGSSAAPCRPSTASCRWPSRSRAAGSPRSPSAAHRVRPTSQDINSQAAPLLVQETMSAQSAQIDSISGATYTSAGYLQSLQSALDQAGLK